MKRFVLTRPAERDLDQIKSYLVEKAGPRITRKVFQEIRTALKLLGSNPGIGHTREDLTDRPVKFWPVYSYLESTDLRGAASHAAKLVPSALDRSRRSRRNFTRVTILAAVARNSGKVLRRAIATTCSEGASPGRTVRIQEPKDCHTNLGFIAERI